MVCLGSKAPRLCSGWRGLQERWDPRVLQGPRGLLEL